MSRHYTIAEAAAHLGLSPRYVRRLAQTGKIESTRVGPRLYLIPANAVRDYERQPRGNPQWRRKRP